MLRLGVLVFRVEIDRMRVSALTYREGNRKVPWGRLA